MAGRGARRRVRLLLDDLNTEGAAMRSWPTLDAHPNIEVRLYNPLVGATPALLIS
jgi:putative cardiolipin synthase